MFEHRSTVYKCIVFVLLVTAWPGCAGQHTSLVPAAPSAAARVPIVSHVTTSDGQMYTIDEMYAPSPSNLKGIAPGLGGRVWFTGDVLSVGTSSVTGRMSEIAVPPGTQVSYIVEGPDRNMWLMLIGAVAKMSGHGTVTAFPVPRAFGNFIDAPIVSSGGYLWFLGAGSSTPYLVRTTTEGKMNGYKLPVGSHPASLAVASDGALWITDGQDNSVRRMIPGGASKTYSVPTANAYPFGICQGPNDAMWFLEYSANKIASVTNSGTFHEYPIPTPYSESTHCVGAPDGAVWFTESIGKIGRVTSSGGVTELPLAAPAANPSNMAIGSDKNVWFTESQAAGIVGRIELQPGKNSAPVYSSFTLKLKKRPQLGLAEKIPLQVQVRDLKGNVIQGKYPSPVHLSTTDPKQAALTVKVVTSSTSAVAVSFSGRYTNATIAANAVGGGTSYSATVLPSTPPEKRLPAAAFDVTVGANNSLWMCLSNGDLASRSENGVLTKYPATNYFDVEGCSMVEGPDGNVWFTDYANDRIGKITPKGKLSWVQLDHDDSPFSIAAGSDGALWFTEFSPKQIGRVTTSGRVSTFPTKEGAYDIVAGPDGNLWFNDLGANIYKMTTKGAMTLVRKQVNPGRLWSVAGNLWFTASGGDYGFLEEMSTDGKILKRYAEPPQCSPAALTALPDGTLWYVDDYKNCVARITTSGQLRVVPTHNQKENSRGYAGIAYGPNNDVWFTESGNNGLGWLDPAWM
jgi:virginiamycin B lyase